MSVGFATTLTECGYSSEDTAYSYLIWTKPDQTQVYLTDTADNGQPETVTATPSGDTCNVVGANRGSTFRSYDGSGVTFTLSSGSLTDGVTTSVSGTLTLPNGTQYHTGNLYGDLLSANDRNGNQVLYGAFTPTTSGGSYSVTDSAGRSETLTFTEDPNTADPGYSANDVISYSGASGASRDVYVTHQKLSSVLATGEANLTLGCLFPATMNSTSTYFGDNFYVISSIQLADGSKYSFLYNSYGEVKQLTLPTGAMYRYVWPEATSCSDMTGADYGYYSGVNAIVRRVLERDEVAPDGTVLSKQLFTPTVITDPDISGRTATSVQVDFKNGTGTLLLRREVHQFWGDPTTYVPPASPVAYPGWTDGIEYESDVYDTDGITLLSAERKVWQQRPCVSGTENCWFTPSTTTSRANDLQLCQTLTSLGGSISGAELFYNTTLPFNQQTDLYEYDYATSGFSVAANAACPTSAYPSFLRRTNTQYYSGGTSYWNANLNQLPSAKIVYNGSTLAAEEQWVYDQASPDGLTGLTAASGLATNSHDDTDYGAGNAVRGNVTTHQEWSSTAGIYLPEYFTYDTASSPLKHVDFDGNLTTFAYADGAHVGPTTVTNAMSRTQTFVYDQHILRPTSSTDENSVTTDYLYPSSDAMDRLGTVKRAVGVTSVETWTQYSYPVPSGGVLPSPLDVKTSQDQTSAGDGALRTDTLYDGFGRPIETDQYETSSHYIATTTAYDALGRVQQTTNPSRFTAPGSGDGLGYATSYAYDGLGRVLSVTPPDSSTVTASYSGNQTTVSVPGGGPGTGNSVPIVRTSTSDAAGRVTSVVENPGGSPSYTTSYTYDVLDNLLTVTQGSETRTFTYNSLSRLMMATNPESGTVCYGTYAGSTCTGYYDDNGNLIYRTDYRGVGTLYAYDALNRLTSVTYTDGTPPVSYAYGSSSGFYDRLVSVTAGSGSTAVTNTISSYDALGRITGSSESVNGGTTSYTFSYVYNLAGALTSETYPSSRTVTTGYDGANRPNSLASGGTTYVSGLSYAPHGAPAAYLYANGMNRAQTFNNRLQPTDMKDWLTSGGSTDPLLELGYTYGGGGAFNNGDPTAIAVTTAQIPGGAQTNFSQAYAYDAFNRLCLAAEGITVAKCSSSVSGNLWAQQFGYDQYGNMTGTSSTGIPALPSGSYNLQNQLTGTYTCGSTGSVPFDCSGNQRTRGSSSLSYDAENRQTVDYDTVSGNTINYAYDGMGERVKKALVSGYTTVYVRDAFGNLAAEYTTGGGYPMPCTTCYLSWDHLGSTRMVTDSGGNVVPYGRHDYLPFGYEIPAGIGGRTDGIWTGSGTDYLTAKYTGAERDTETGFDFMQARYHANVQGRFMSPDPGNAGADLGTPQSWNGYSYVGNNPMAYIDPSGLSCTDPNDTSVPCFTDTVTASGGDGYLPPPAPPGSCYSVILDGVPQQNSCDEGLNIITLNVKTPPSGPVSSPPGYPLNQGCQVGTMNLRQNIKLAKGLSFFFWAGLATNTAYTTGTAAGTYVDLVRVGGAWDPKDTVAMTPANVAAGNVNFGATCSQFGFNTWLGGQVCQYGAGIYGKLKGTFGSPLFSASHGDIPRDNQQVRQGLAIAKSGRCN